MGKAGENIMTNRELARDIAFHFLGKPYIWGGDDPMAGFDCSGFMIELLQSVGALPRKFDTTAAGLYQMLPHVSGPGLGHLVFWGNPIIHVEFCLGDKLAIGASGGGSGTITVGDAIRQNAYIKIRPFRSRPRIYGFADPFLNGV